MLAAFAAGASVEPERVLELDRLPLSVSDTTAWRPSARSREAAMRQLPTTAAAGRRGDTLRYCFTMLEPV